MHKKKKKFHPNNFSFSSKEMTKIGPTNDAGARTSE